MPQCIEYLFQALKIEKINVLPVLVRVPLKKQDPTQNQIPISVTSIGGNPSKHQISDIWCLTFLWKSIDFIPTQTASRILDLKFTFYRFYMSGWPLVKK